MIWDWNGWVKQVRSLSRAVCKVVSSSIGQCAKLSRHQNCTLGGSSTLWTAAACHLCQPFWPHLNCILHSLLLPGHCFPGWCEYAVLSALSMEQSRVWWSFTKGLRWQKICTEKITDRWQADMKIQRWQWQRPFNRVSSCLVSCLPCCKAGSPLPHTLSLGVQTPIAFSWLWQEETRTFLPHLPVTTMGIPQVCSLFGWFLRQYVEFQFLDYFGYSTNFT